MLRHVDSRYTQGTQRGVRGIGGEDREESQQANGTLQSSPESAEFPGQDWLCSSRRKIRRRNPNSKKSLAVNGLIRSGLWEYPKGHSR